MLILAPVRARIDDGVLMLRVAEQAERERAQQSGQWEYAQLYADINALAPEVVRTCQQLGLKKSKLKQRFQMPTRPWYFYIHPSNDPAQRMGLAFFPDGRWEFVGNCTAKQINTLWVVPKEGQVSWSSDRGSLSKGNLHADLIRGLGEKRCAGSWGRHIPPLLHCSSPRSRFRPSRATLVLTSMTPMDKGQVRGGWVVTPMVTPMDTYGGGTDT